MNTNVIEKFNGEINSVKINNSNIFSSIEYILEKSNMPKISFSKSKEKSRLER